MKKIENEELQDKLDFLGLSLDKIPKFIKESEVPSFNISRLNNDKDLKIYRFVPIDKIEILLTPALRSDNIKVKYAEAMPLKFFLNADGDEEEQLLFKTFSKIVRSMQTKEIERITDFQENLNGEEPFKVKYNRDHLWQIYYSEAEDKYFMLVCTKEEIFSEFLYLLKAQIDFYKKRKKDAPRIYVPINYVGYSEQILEKSEIADIENYLWLFTQNWPLIFEVYDINNVLSLKIVGETFVYKNIKSNYKVELKSTQEAIKFYKLLKALFILQTEIKDQYKFETRIDGDNGISMFLSKVEITFDTLTQFIKNEYLLADYEITNQNKTISEVEEKLANLKKEVKEKEDEYLKKQKEISTYLECKKTFIGKVKYFFRKDKKKKKSDDVEEKEEVTEVKSVEIDTKPLNTYVQEQEKAFYTIEDLVTIYSLHEKGQKYYKNVKQDIKALELKLENLKSKVRNANLYIEEIDKHKKSIFEFWKFANKDEKLAIEMGDGEEDMSVKNEFKKFFDYEMDFDKLGEEVDSVQRKKLSHEETDSVFIAQTDILRYLNMVRSNTIIKYDLEALLENLKEEFNDDRLVVDSETFDIFGNIEENNNKVKYIGSRSHREVEKNKFKIMNVNKKIDVFDFTEKIQSVVNYLDGAIPKITSKYDISLYKLVPISQQIAENNFDTYNINVENELLEFKESDESAYNLIVLNYKEGMPLLYFSNIMFFDNTNSTLPLGMNLSTKVLIDNKRLEFSLSNKTKFRTNSYFGSEGNKLKSKDIFVYEYDVFLKSEKEEDVVEDDEIEEISEEVFIDNVPVEDNEIEEEEDSLFESIDKLDNLDEITDEYIDPNEEVEDEIIEKKEENSSVMKETLVNKSKKLLKLEEKMAKELEKEQKKQEKERKKLEKKEKKGN